MLRTAYAFRVPGPVFKAGLIFLSFLFSCTFFPFQHTKGVDDAQIRQYFCCIASFFGSCAQLRDTAGPNIFQIAKNKLLTFAARFSHHFQQGRCCPNPTQHCLYPGLKGASTTQTGTLTTAAPLGYQHIYKTKK